MIEIRRPRAKAKAAARRVLAICGDSQVGLWMARSLARGGLTVYAVCNSARGQAAHSRFVAGAWAVDRRPGAENADAQILRLAAQLEVGSIMPIAEDTHAALIARRAEIEPAIHLFSPAAEAFARATDKSSMHRLCEELGVPVARGTTLDCLMGGGGGAPLAFPLVLRTRCQTAAGAARQAPWKAAYAADRRQLEGLYRSVESIAENVLVQEYHPGAEDHVQVLMHGGEAFAAGEYIGEHHMPLAGGVTVQRVSCKHPRVINDAVRLLKALHWEGIAGVQFHYDPRTERYIFLEINPRFIGGLPTVIMAGCDAPFLLWQSRFEPQRMRPARYRTGLRTRILGGDANWLLAHLRGDALPPDQEPLGKFRALSRFAWNCGPWTKDDSFLLSDPKPFLVDLWQMLGKLRGEGFDILGAGAANEAANDAANSRNDVTGGADEVELEAVRT